ncbi:MAG TPA: hypothetical protein VH559_06675 [Gemmatimonadaceae bacterium]
MSASEMALVCAADGVLLVLVDDTQEELDRRLAEWAADRAACVLWPADARRMHDFVRRGLIAESIRWYFTRVGQRWDREWLLRVTSHCAQRRGFIAPSVSTSVDTTET